YFTAVWRAGLRPSLKLTKLVTAGCSIFVSGSELATPCTPVQCAKSLMRQRFHALVGNREADQFRYLSAPKTCASLTCPFVLVIAPFGMSASSPLPQIVTAVRAESLGVPQTSPVPRAQSRLTSHESLAMTLRSYYDSLYAAHGPQHWWPGRSR